jgi:adenylate cyclase
LGDAGFAASEVFRDLRRAHEELLDAYRCADVAKARAALDEASAMAPEQLAGLYRIYAERLDVFAATPPRQGWDGVFVAERK